MLNLEDDLVALADMVQHMGAKPVAVHAFGAARRGVAEQEMHVVVGIASKPNARPLARARRTAAVQVIADQLHRLVVLAAVRRDVYTYPVGIGALILDP